MNAVETCKKILIFPDVDAYDYWKEKFKARPKLEIYISDYLQKSATEEDLNNHIDIADWHIRWHNDPDTVSVPPETPIQPIQEARHQLTIQELKQYLSPESMDQVATLVGHLQLRGYDAELLVPEVEDISLKERVRRANKITCQIGHPVQETIIISIHVDGIENFIIRRNHEPL